MNDASEEDVARSSDMDAMRLLAQKFATKSSRARPVKVERKEKEKKARSIVDGRSLRAKGRTEQLNVKVRPDIKQALAERVAAEGVTIADWLEHTLEVALRGI